MDRIALHQVLPDVFKGRDGLCSDVWLKEVAFEKGRSYLVDAASGTGKTSMCSFIYGSRNDYQGVIEYDSRDARSLSERELMELRRTSLGILFQDLRLFADLTSMENILVKNRLTGFRTESWIREMFERLSIGDKLSQRAGTLSWGQQQRVAFIRALCQPVDFLILDEPVSHLDQANGLEMAQIISELRAETGACVIATSVGHPLIMDYDVKLSL